jgi:hypothetical protein
MHKNTLGVFDHMRDLGLSMIGRAVYDATYAEIQRPYAHALAVMHAAQGAEIVVKARIAQEHPLLVFKNLPKSTVTPGRLGIAQLLEHGRTYEFAELPELLWATTGYRMRNTPAFMQFGRLRNRIVHFTVPRGNLAAQTFHFVFEVIEPMVHDFWKWSVLAHADLWANGELEVDLRRQLRRYRVKLPRETRELLANWGAA